MSCSRRTSSSCAFVVLIGPAVSLTATAPRNQLDWIAEPSLERVWNLFQVTTGRNAALGLAAAGGLALLACRVSTGTAAAAFRLALVGGWVALPMGLGLLVSEWQPILVSRYAIVITPALALAGAAAVAALARARREIAACALIALIAISGYRVVDWYRSTPEDWRGAAAYIASERRPGDAVPVAPAWATDGYRYYDSEAPIGAPVPGRRTFVVVRTVRGQGLLEMSGGTIDPDRLTLVDERSFGRKLLVQVYEPRT